MKIHYAKITMLRLKKEKTGEAARNLPPVLKGRGKAEKIVVPRKEEIYTFKTSAVGTEDEIKADPYYRKIAFSHKTIPGSWDDYVITNVEFLKEQGETAWDKPKPVIIEKLKEFPAYDPKEIQEKPVPFVPEKQWNFPPIKFG